MYPALVELVERTAAKTGRHIDAMADGLRGEIAEVKRHSDVIAEGLRGEIRLVAEAVVATNERLDARIDDLRNEMREGFADVRAMIGASYRDLDRRVTRLESGAG